MLALPKPVMIGQGTIKSAGDVRHAGLPHFKWSNLLRVVVLKEPSGRSDLPSNGPADGASAVRAPRM
jgi:hypothetical protein